MSSLDSDGPLIPKEEVCSVQHNMNQVRHSSAISAMMIRYTQRQQPKISIFNFQFGTGMDGSSEILEATVNGSNEDFTPSTKQRQRRPAANSSAIEVCASNRI